MRGAMSAREMVPELLDILASDDPRAVRSRADLLRINGVMRQSAIMAKRMADLPAPKILADLGGGDGRFMLGVAKRLKDRWQDVTVVIADRKPVVSAQTRAGFVRVGWRCESLTGDIFTTLPLIRPDIVTANLFLHHLEEGALAQLLALVAERSKSFVACEPRRSAFALLGARLVGVLGANDVTRHDAVASVRAGFRGTELSALWPATKDHAWNLRERGILPFTHALVAHAV
jgi:hypothetical protein